MKTERVLAGLVLVFSVYGGVWAVLCKTSLSPIFAALILISIWTVHEVWSQVEVTESDEG